MKCKHKWGVVSIDPYVSIPINDSHGTLAEAICVCLKCEKFKTLDVERIKEQTKGFVYNEGCEPPIKGEENEI